MRSGDGKTAEGMKRAFCLIALIMSAGGPVLAVEAPRPRNSAKLIVLNDDGYSGFYLGQYRTPEDLRKRVLNLRDTPVAVFEWCITSGSRVNYPSLTTELIGEGVAKHGRRGDQLAAETLHRLAADGVDTLEVVAHACHESGIRCYASMRMNGDYPVRGTEESLARSLNSSFWWTHPEYRVRGRKGEDMTRLSFAFAEVREFKLRILREAAERDIDGINLDFLRHPSFFGYEEPLLTAFQSKYGQDPRELAGDDARWVQLRSDIMTGFLRDTRRLLDEAGRRKGRRLGLSARVDWRDYRAWGCDLETWLKEGLVDYLVLAQHTLGGYEFDITPFVEMARGTGCAVLFGEEATLSGHDRTAEEDKLVAEGKMKPPARTVLSREQYQNRAVRWYAAGADGVHLFNEGQEKLMGVLIKPTTRDPHAQGEAPADAKPGVPRPSK